MIRKKIFFLYPISNVDSSSVKKPSLELSKFITCGQNQTQKRPGTVPYLNKRSDNRKKRGGKNTPMAHTCGSEKSCPDLF